jgi:hypothetical protein
LAASHGHLTVARLHVTRMQLLRLQTWNAAEMGNADIQATLELTPNPGLDGKFIWSDAKRNSIPKKGLNWDAEIASDNVMSEHFEHIHAAARHATVSWRFVQHIEPKGTLKLWKLSYDDFVSEFSALEDDCQGKLFEQWPRAK